MTSTVELAGAPRKLAFPQACASCGTPAGRRLRIEKVFQRERRDQPDRYAVVGVDVPFCTTCIERHRSEVRHLAPVQGLLSLLRSVLLIPAGVFLVVALVLILPLFHKVADGNWHDVWIFLALVAGFGVLGLACARAALHQSHRYRVTEPTSVTSAFDFSDNLSGRFERERHSYRLLNARFADAFVAVNASRVWHNQGRSARGR